MMKKNTIAALLVIVAIVGTFTATITIIQQSAEAYIDPGTNLREPKAPMADLKKMVITSMSYGGQTGQETGK